MLTEVKEAKEQVEEARAKLDEAQQEVSKAEGVLVEAQEDHAKKLQKFKKLTESGRPTYIFPPYDYVNPVTGLRPPTYPPWDIEIRSSSNSL